jgi:DNA polymerase III delta subunit
MKGSHFKKQLKNGKIANQYLLIADEPLLIDNAIKSIQEVLHASEPFDHETFSATETPAEEIIQKLYLTPFGSAKRLIVVKHLEELKAKTLPGFSKIIGQTRSQNCLVITYQLEKDARRQARAPKRIVELFPHANSVLFSADKNLVHTWISNKIKRDNMKLSPLLASYLEEEFNNDITGLKNEFDKIENYLYEAGTMNASDIEDISKGLCNFNKYQIANSLVNGREDVLELFEELRPYIRHYAEIVDGLTRSFVFYVQRNKSSKKSMVALTDEVVKIDRQVKNSSSFVHLMLELFFLKNTTLFRKGAIYGR